MRSILRQLEFHEKSSALASIVTSRPDIQVGAFSSHLLSFKFPGFGLPPACRARTDVKRLLTVVSRPSLCWTSGGPCRKQPAANQRAHHPNAVGRLSNTWHEHFPGSTRLCSIEITESVEG